MTRHVPTLPFTTAGPEPAHTCRTLSSSPSRFKM